MPTWGSGCDVARILSALLLMTAQETPPGTCFQMAQWGTQAMGCRKQRECEAGRREQGSPWNPRSLSDLTLGHGSLFKCVVPLGKFLDISELVCTFQIAQLKAVGGLMDEFKCEVHLAAFWLL